MFDPNRVYDQNRRRLFKRLKIFTIIKGSFDWREGVTYPPARAYLLDHRVRVRPKTGQGETKVASHFMNLW